MYNNNTTTKGLRIISSKDDAAGAEPEQPTQSQQNVVSEQTDQNLADVTCTSSDNNSETTDQLS